MLAEFATVDELLALRTDTRHSEFAADFPTDWDTGGCSVVSEVLHVTYGLAMDGGCFVDGDKHYAHYWNVLPDGTIFDLTVDQFGFDPFEGAPPDRYDASCGCGKDG